MEGTNTDRDIWFFEHIYLDDDDRFIVIFIEHHESDDGFQVQPKPVT